jgi:hypothetical protein
MPDEAPPASRFARLRRWPLGRIALTLSCVLLAVAAFESYRAWQIVGDVNDGRAYLRSGQSLLERKRLDAKPEDLGAARADFAGAAGKFAGANSRLHGDPLISVLRHLPLAGGQVDAAVSLAEIGEAGAAIGAGGVDAVDAFNQVREQGEGTLPEKTVAVIDAVDPHVQKIEAQLRDVDALRAGIGDRTLIGPMQRGISELDARRQRLRDFLDTYNRARVFAPEFLGFNGPRTYLVLAQNQAELLPTGGLVSVVGTVHLDRGHVKDMQFEDAVRFGEEWMARENPHVEAPRPLRQYLLKDTSWNLAVSTWSPDFPTSAKTARSFFVMGGGQQVDGVIGMNVTTLQRLLAITGPVDVPEFDVTVDADNAWDLIEANTRAPYEHHTDRKAFAGILADGVLQRVLHPQPGQWSPLIDLLQKLGDEKDLLLFTSDARQEDLIHQFGWDGAVGYTGGDYLQVIDASVNSTKLNAVIRHSAKVEVKLDGDGAATTTVALDYDNDLAGWSAGRDPVLVETLMLKGQYGGYVRLLTPPGSKITSVKDESGEIGVEEVSNENGLASFGRFFALPRDTKKHLVFSYSTPPNVVKQGSTWTYTLHLRRQPGWELPISVRIDPPPGMHASSMSLDGAPFATPGVDMKIDLSRDRLLAVTFKG